MSEKVKASAIYAEAFRLEAEVVRLKQEVAAAEERGRRAGIEEAAKWMRKPDAAQMLFTLEQTGFLAPRDSGKEPK